MIEHAITFLLGMGTGAVTLAAWSVYSIERRERIKQARDAEAIAKMSAYIAANNATRTSTRLKALDGGLAGFAKAPDHRPHIRTGGHLPPKPPPPAPLGTLRRECDPPPPPRSAA